MSLAEVGGSMEADSDSTRSEDPDLAALVEAAGNGDHCAWRELHRRYASLIAGTARRYRLSDSDAADVAQAVWLQLIRHVSRLREPCALPGWIVVTTRNEALRVVRKNRRTEAIDITADPRFDYTTFSDVDERLLQRELQQSMHECLKELRSEHRQLLLLVVDPAVSYKEISIRLGIPIGSIGPTRARCLEKLRSSRAVRELAERIA